MNRPFPSQLAFAAFALVAIPGLAAELPKPKPPEMPPFEVAKPFEKELARRTTSLVARATAFSSSTRGEPRRTRRT